MEPSTCKDDDIPYIHVTMQVVCLANTDRCRFDVGELGFESLLGAACYKRT